MGKTIAVDGETELDPDAIAYPCGLVAKTFFNDTFELYLGQQHIEFDTSDIAWNSDVEFRFKNQADNWDQKQWLDVEDPHFIVWMRVAGLPKFRKLYGALHTDLVAGNYNLKIENNFDVSQFDGTKKFVLSTTNALGGQNYFLAGAYLVVGAMCILFGVLFLVLYIVKKNRKPIEPPSNRQTVDESQK